MRPPSGGGYLHLLMFLDTRGPRSEIEREHGGMNRFIAGELSARFHRRGSRCA